jgi:hypothetical protein
MNQTYLYDDLYGTLLRKNEDDTERIYFVIQCQFWKFYTRMYSHGWNLIGKDIYERNGLKGYEVTFNKNYPTE